MELSSELTGELLGMMGDKGEVEFGQSEDKDRTMAAVMSEVMGEKTGGEQIQEKYDDGLTPRQRAEVKWTLMKQGLAAWWEQNKVTIIAGAIAAIVGVIALIIVTGGAILAAIPPIMSVLGPIFTGLTVAVLAGHVRDYVSKSWNKDTEGGAKSLAKGLAAGAIELLSWLTFKAGEAAFKGVKVLAKGGMALAKGIGKQIGRGMKFIIEKGKVLFKGIAGSGIGKRLKSLAELGKNLLERMRFKKFRIRFANGLFKLEGFINPWILLAEGKVKYVEQADIKRVSGEGTAQVGDLVKYGRKEGIVIGSHGKDLEHASSYVRELEDLGDSQLSKRFRELKELESEARKAKITGSKPFDYDEAVKRIGEKSANAIRSRGSLATNLGPKPGTDFNAHHIIPVELANENTILQKAIEAGFDFNGKVNGRWLKRFSSDDIFDDAGKLFASKTGVHASHDSYTEKVRNLLNRLKRVNLNPDQLKGRVEEIAKMLGEIIDKNPNVKINDLQF